MEGQSHHTRSPCCLRRAGAFERLWLCLTWQSSHGTLAVEGSLLRKKRLVLVLSRAIDDVPVRRAKHIDRRCYAGAELVVTSVVPEEEDMP
jgi:hypothetical protein